MVVKLSHALLTSLLHIEDSIVLILMCEMDCKADGYQHSGLRPLDLTWTENISKVNARVAQIHIIEVHCFTRIRLLSINFVVGVRIAIYPL